MFKTDISKYPQSASLSEWARIIGYSIMTLSKDFRAGRLKGQKQPNGKVIAAREAICARYKITHAEPATAGNKRK